MSKQKLPRGRRGGVSVVVALVVIAAAALSAVTAIQLYLARRHTAVGDVASYGHDLRTQHWDGNAALICGVVLAVLGVLVLLSGLLPAGRQLLTLADPDENTIAGVTRDGLRDDMVASALAVDGVVSADATVRRRRIRIVAETPFTDRDGLADAIRHACQQRIDALQPVQKLTVRARLRRKVSRKEA